MGDAMGAMGAAGAGVGILSIAKYIIIVLIGGVLLGAVGGLVYAGIRYPNPNKRALFSAKQKIVVLIVLVVSLALVVGAFVYKPKPKDDMLVNAGMGDGMVGEDGLPLGEEGAMDGMEGGEPVADGAANPVTDQTTPQASEEGEAGAGEEESSAGEGEDASSSESASEASSSESSSEASMTGSVNGGGGGGPVSIGRGGMVMVG